MTPAGRLADTALIRATGDEARTIIAGYHWFTDWGRDTMINLEGLTLLTGRHQEAGYILRTFAHYVRDGLIPNMFPEGTREGLYHTADASLWYFHAIDRYLRATGDRGTLRLLLPTLVSIVDHHVRGTRFGIGVDPADGLLRQGEAGYQLTWMDAKVEDWVVTPRRGKAVEINALWYNALRLLQGWLGEEQGPDAARPHAARADQVRTAFNARFWYADGGYLYDVIDGEKGDDPACRPNQLFAISLAHPVLAEARWAPVLAAVKTAPADARGTSHPGAGSPRLQGDLRRRSPGARRGVSPGHGVAVADRALRRGVAAHAPGGARGRPPSPGPVLVPSRRRLRRQHQRDLRCGAALHASRVHRSGLERRRGASRAHLDAGIERAGAGVSRRGAMTGVIARTAAGPLTIVRA